MDFTYLVQKNSMMDKKIGRGNLKSHHSKNTFEWFFEWFSGKMEKWGENDCELNH